MNERIKELAKQAWVCQATEYQVNGVGTHRTYKDVFSEQKFAELIVKECLSLLGSESAYGANHIRKHFGVEE